MNYNLKKKYQIATRRYYINNSPSKEISKLISLDKKDFISYIDSFLIDGMNKENFGIVWGIDHIIPVEVFDLNNENDKKLCYHYLNLMPMFNNDNKFKGASIHFSLIKLNRLKEKYSNVYILDELIKKANYEIEKRYNKYLNIS